jgi:hypothetical protein
MLGREANIVLLERELHFPKHGERFNHYVCFAWNLREERSSHKQGDSVITTTEKVRTGEPYITFTMVREFSDGVAEDDNSPVDGGMSLPFAKDIARELELACVYLERIKN